MATSWRHYLATLVFSLLVLACGKSPEEARKELAELNIPFSRESFIERVRNGDTVAVSLFLRAGMSPDVRAEGDNPALAIAAARGDVSLVEALLAEGADVDIATDGATALYFAIVSNRNLSSSSGATKGHRRIVELLLAKRADPNAKGRYYGQSPVKWTAKFGDHDLLNLLLQHDGNRADALSAAAAASQTGVVEDLLERGTDANALDSDGWPALSRASAESAKLLVEGGADVEVRSPEGGTPLHYAAREGQEPKVSLLLASGAKVNARVERPANAPALERITSEEKAEFRELIRAEAQDSETIKEQFVRLSEETRVFAAIFERPAEGLPAGSTPLIRAASLLHADCVRVLLNNGADVNAEDRRGRTALMWAAYGRDKWPSLHGEGTEDAYRAVRSLLIEAGASE